ncbi:aspartate--ammonia ligase [candidate division WOR-3 bacterium]|nr:aspartate--ammonia ligase [candidate division WOR-3 bacterium]
MTFSPVRLKLPKGFRSHLNLKETEEAIKYIKDSFQTKLCRELNLKRVSATIVVLSRTGINDNLTGIENPISFNVTDIEERAEIVQSLAKWKRMALADYGFKCGEGLYTDMNAIRPDESLDNLHSIYVDQWDWERAIKKEDRNLGFLEKIVKGIYNAMKDTEKIVYKNYFDIKPVLPEDITFVHTEDLIEKYPDLIPQERENKIAEEYKAVFLVGMGGELKDGTIHDGRAPDYDDWSTSTRNGKKGLNGDIIVWNPVIEKAFELSSMGIRVDREAMLRQLKIRNAEDRKELEWHKRLFAGEFPESIGGGIGQSRLCMFFLRKVHIGEVQASVWPQGIIEHCKNHNINLL